MNRLLVGTSRCDVPARVQRAERIAQHEQITPYVAPLLRGADGAARRPYPGSWSQGASPYSWRLPMNRSNYAKRLGVRALLRRFCLHPHLKAPEHWAHSKTLRAIPGPIGSWSQCTNE